MTHRPHQRRCSICTKLSSNCDHLNFSKMEPIGGYANIIILVKCSDFKYRER